MKANIILIGLGNPILGDDGVGWKVVEYLQQHSSLPTSIDIDFLALGGISLMERLIGYDQAILVDAIITGQHPIGSVLCFEVDELPNLAGGHLAAAHDTSLQVALQMGHSMDAKLPRRITIIAVEAQSVYDFSEDLTLPIKAAVPEAAKMVMTVMAESSNDPPDVAI